NDPSGYFTSDELARIQDAINGLDTLLAPYSVTISEVSDPSLANVILDNGTTSAAGTAAQGVLGSESASTASSEITILQGWNWYAGSDATAIGSDQYDFQTVVTHELGHALGLGHNTNSSSVMHASLAAGTTRRSMVAADLNIPDPPGGADPLMAAGFPSSTAAVALAQNASATALNPAGNPSLVAVTALPAASIAATRTIEVGTPSNASAFTHLPT